ncbi:MAG: SMI1/KNR4 family protein [Reyranellaceae bacterium]
MMLKEMLDVGPPLTKARIEIIEKRLGVTLPGPYKDFLLQYNGGRPKPMFFPIRDFARGTSGAVHYFFDIDGSMDGYNLDWTFEIFKGRVPKGFFPIAGDEAGNLICLAYEGDRLGEVYFWDHDEEGDPRTARNVYFVASSFEEFLESLHDEDLSEEVARILGEHHKQ